MQVAKVALFVKQSIRGTKQVLAPPTVELWQFDSTAKSTCKCSVKAG
jgi:hypothetical protein